jgi:hypothetical protein
MTNYMAFAKENKGVFRIGAVDCDSFGDICSKEGINDFPTFRTYPPFPAPVSDSTNGFDAKAVKRNAGKWVTDRSIEINNNNHATFIGEDVSIPKVLLFTK